MSEGMYSGEHGSIRDISPRIENPICCNEEMVLDQEKNIFTCYKCGAEIKFLPNKDKMLCCGQRMVMADDHGTASCKICGEVRDI